MAQSLRRCLPLRIFTTLPEYIFLFQKAHLAFFFSGLATSMIDFLRLSLHHDRNKLACTSLAAEDAIYLPNLALMKIY